MKIHDLGPIVVDVQGRSVELGLTRQAALLARLVVSVGEQVSQDALIAAAWGPQAKVSASGLDSQLWRLRNVLEPDRGRASSVVTRSGSGYRIRIAPDQLDSARFVRLADEVEVAAADGTAAAEVLNLLDEALGLWRGRPYEPIADSTDVAPATARLTVVRSQLSERRIEALIAAGQPDRALADVEPLIAETPYREHLWGLRIAVLARLGRTEEALATYQHVRERLQDELGLDPGAELRDIQSRVLSGELAGTVRPVPVAPPVPASSRSRKAEIHVPRRATRLLGRAQDLDRIVALVAEHSLVTVTGVGGCGKTRISVEVAATVAADYADGVWFVDLTSAARGMHIADVVISTLGLAASPIGDPLEMLADYVSDKSILLVMDNCEHVLTSVAQCVEVILTAGRGLVVLATSREPLELDGEIVWSLSPLSVLTARSPGTAASAGVSPAVELFLDRARAADPTLDLGPDELDSVERICRSVDGLPLAIELAAARVRMFALAEIADQVSADPTRLGRIGRGRVDHRSTIYDAIEWSYRLLGTGEKSLHRRLSVLPGAFPLAAVRGIAGAGHDDHAVAESLAALVHGSMLVTRRSAGGTTTFAQLDTVRAHARRRLAETGEENEIVRARDDWVRQLLSRRPPVGRGEEARWFDEVDESYVVVRACLQDQLDGGGDPVLVRLGANLSFYWYYRSRVVEGARWLEAALTAAAEPENALEAATRRLRLASLWLVRSRRDLAEPLLAEGLQHLDRAVEESPAEAAELLIPVAASAWLSDAYDIMRGLHERLQRMLPLTNDPHLDVLAEAIGCVSRLRVLPLEVSKSAATAIFERATEIGNVLAQWLAGLACTVVARLEHDPVDGMTWTRRVVPIFLRLGNGGGEVFLESLGDFAAMSGDFTEAARLYAGAIGSARRSGTPWPSRPQNPPLYDLTASSLSPAEFAAASAAGASLTLAEVAGSW